MSSAWDTPTPKSGNGQYSVDNFYPESTDNKGHYEQFRVKLPVSVAGRIGTLISTQKLPYRTVGDFFRDAVVHRAIYLERLIEDNDLKWDVNFLLRVIEAETEAKKLKHEEELIESRSKLLSGASGAEEKARFVRECEEDLKYMKFGGARQRMEELIRRYE